MYNNEYWVYPQIQNTEVPFLKWLGVRVQNETDTRFVIIKPFRQKCMSMTVDRDRNLTSYIIFNCYQAINIETINIFVIRTMYTKWFNSNSNNSNPLLIRCCYKTPSNWIFSSFLGSDRKTSIQISISILFEYKSRS